MCNAFTEKSRSDNIKAIVDWCKLNNRGYDAAKAIVSIMDSITHGKHHEDKPRHIMTGRVNVHAPKFAHEELVIEVDVQLQCLNGLSEWYPDFLTITASPDPHSTRLMNRDLGLFAVWLPDTTGFDVYRYESGDCW